MEPGVEGTKEGCDLATLRCSGSCFLIITQQDFFSLLLTLKIKKDTKSFKRISPDLVGDLDSF